MCHELTGICKNLDCADKPVAVSKLPQCALHSWMLCPASSRCRKPHSPGHYCLDAGSATGFCTPKAVIKIFTTTIMNTSPVARLLRKFSFPCFAGLLRSYFTSKRKEKKMFNDMNISKSRIKGFILM